MRRLTIDLIATGLSSLNVSALSALSDSSKDTCLLTFPLAGSGDSSPPAGALLGFSISSTVGVRVLQLEDDDPSIRGVVFEHAPLKGKLNVPISCNRLTEDDELVVEGPG